VTAAQDEAEGDQHDATDRLDGEPVMRDDAGYRADAHRGRERDQAIPEHGAEAGCNTARDTALQRALNTQYVDGTDGGRYGEADKQSDRDNQGIGDNRHGLTHAQSSSNVQPEAWLFKTNIVWLV
jgi:hypothetical protein